MASFCSVLLPPPAVADDEPISTHCVLLELVTACVFHSFISLNASRPVVQAAMRAGFASTRIKSSLCAAKCTASRHTHAARSPTVRTAASSEPVGQARTAHTALVDVAARIPNAVKQSKGVAAVCVRSEWQCGAVRAAAILMHRAVPTKVVELTTQPTHGIQQQPTVPPLHAMWGQRVDALVTAHRAVAGHDKRT